MSLSRRNDERFAGLTPLSADERSQVEVEFSGVPRSYVDFLTAVGSGDIGPGSVMLYGTPMSPGNIYDAASIPELNGLLVFADDYTGTCFAFDPSQSWAVVEIDSVDHSRRNVARSFDEFVRKTLDEIG